LLCQDRLETETNVEEVEGGRHLFAAREKLPVVVVLLANRAYGIFGTELDRLGLNDSSEKSF
jgi:thiamine pyrophosphate-dependent acetolactate synthase large subunit-like protein